MLAGAAAGLLGWGITEPFSPGLGDPFAWQRWEMLFAALVGGLIGFSIGAVNGWNQGSTTHLLRGAIVGLLIGALAGLLGLQVGGAIFTAVTGQSGLEGLPMLKAVVARTLAFIPFGGMIGIVMGAAGMSWKRAWVGGIGGCIGGALGGLSFDLVASILGPIQLAAKGGMGQIGPDNIPRMTAEVGGPSRAVFAVLLGASIGLFTAVFARATRTAWLRLVLGRNEGKEWIVDAYRTFIGRSERAHVPLFGDPNIAPMHACIERTNSGYVLIDGGSALGTGLNGQRITSAPLVDGASIQICGYTLIFMLRAGAARRAAEAASHAAGGRPAPTPSQAIGAHTVVAPVAHGIATPVARPSVPAVGMGNSTLVAVDGPLIGQRFEVTGMIEIGRETGPIPLAHDWMLSRRHARISPLGSAALEVVDLQSTNGTFVNGTRITTATIKNGDVLKLGVTTFRVE